MAERTVSFRVDGDPSGGVNALDTLIRKLNEVATNKAFVTLTLNANNLKDAVKSATDYTKALTTAMKETGAASGEIRRNLGGLAQMSRTAAGSLSAQRREQMQILRGQRDQAKAVTQVYQGITRATAAQQALNSRIAQGGQHARGMASGFRGAATQIGVMALNASRLAEGLARSLRFVSIISRAGGGVAAQGLQSFGIGTRMSGLALGQQLAQFGSGGLRGILGSVTGIAAAGAEFATRLVTSITGTLVKLGGSVSSGLLALVGAGLSALGQAVQLGLGGIVGQIGASLGKAAFLALQAIGNVAQGLTNMIGEAVIQVGNVFTGIMEAVRGAFQAALNIAGDIMGKMVELVGSAVEKIGGILGTVGKSLLGVGALIGGFAFHDVLSTERGLSKTEILLPEKLSAKEKRSLYSWAQDMSIQLPTLGRRAIADALTTMVSSGFQSNLPAAKKGAAAALKLSMGLDEGSARDASLTIAKAYNIFRDEIDATAQKTGQDPFEVLTDHLYAFVNASTLQLPEIVQRLGDVMGSAKLAGTTFKELLAILSKASLSLGAEETFTSVNRLFLDFVDMDEKSKKLLDSRGVATKIFGKEEQAQLEPLRKKLAAETSRVSRLKESLGLARGQRALSALDAKDRSDAIDNEVTLLRAKQRRAHDEKDGTLAKDLGKRIRHLQEEKRGLGQGTTLAREILGDRGELKEATETVKKLRAELEGLEIHLGKPRPFQDILKDMSGFSMEEKAIAIPNIRTFRGAMSLLFADPQFVNEITDVFAKRVQGATQKAADIVEDTLGTRLGRAWEAMKRPFENTIKAIEPALFRFLDAATAKIMALSGWWDKVINAPGAARFFDNLSIHLSSIFGGMSLGGGTSPEGFWSAVSTGMETVFNVGKDVAGIFSTIFTAIHGIVKESEFLGQLWEGMKSAGAWMLQTGKQLARGDTTNVKKVWEGATGLFDVVASKITSIFDGVVKQIEAVGRSLLAEGRSLLAGILDFLGKSATTLTAAAGPLIAASLGRGFAGRGGGGGGGIGAAGVMGLIPGPGFGSGLGGGGALAQNGAGGSLPFVPYNMFNLGNKSGSNPGIRRNAVQQAGLQSVLDDWGNNPVARAGRGVGRFFGSGGPGIPLTALAGNELLQHSGASPLLKNVGGGAATGAAFGSFAGPGGAAAGAVIGGLVGALKAMADVTSDLSARHTADALEDFANSVRKFGGVSDDFKRMSLMFSAASKIPDQDARGQAMSKLFGQQAELNVDRIMKVSGLFGTLHSEGPGGLGGLEEAKSAYSLLAGTGRSQGNLFGTAATDAGLTRAQAEGLVQGLADWIIEQQNAERATHEQAEASDKASAAAIDFSEALRESVNSVLQFQGSDEEFVTRAMQAINTLSGNRNAGGEAGFTESSEAINQLWELIDRAQSRINSPRDPIPGTPQDLASRLGGGSKSDLFSPEGIVDPTSGSNATMWPAEPLKEAVKEGSKQGIKEGAKDIKVTVTSSDQEASLLDPETRSEHRKRRRDALHRSKQRRDIGNLGDSYLGFEQMPGVEYGNNRTPVDKQTRDVWNQYKKRSEDAGRIDVGAGGVRPHSQGITTAGNKIASKLDTTTDALKATHDAMGKIEKGATDLANTSQEGLSTANESIGALRDEVLSLRATVQELKQQLNAIQHDGAEQQ